MRSPVLLLVGMVLLAGCLDGATPPTPTPTPTTSKTAPSPTPVPTLAPPTGDCPRVELKVPARIAQWERVEMWANVTNCDDAPLVLRSDERCAFDHGIRVGLTREDLNQSWLLLHGPAYETLGEGPLEQASCGDYPPPERELAPNETWPHQFAWDGSYQAGPCDPGCDTRNRRAADLGAHRVVVSVTLPNGSLAMAHADLEVTPAVLPPMPPPGDVRILLNGTYAANESVEIRVQNVGNATYAYNPHYEACAWRYYNESARPFLVPPGTHCDLVSYGKLEPGQTIAVFNWSMDECVVDLWGCARAAPLWPGEYHVRATFCPWNEHFGQMRTGCVAAGASFRVE